MFSKEVVEEKEFIDFVEQICNAFKIIKAKIELFVEGMDKEYDAWEEKRGKLQITKKIEEASRKYTILKEELGESDAGEPSVYDQLVEEQQVLEEKLKEFATKHNELVKLKEKGENILKQIYEHRLKLSQARKKFLQKTLAENKYVKIELVPFGDIGSVEEELRRLINRESGFDRDIGAIDSEEGLLSAFNQESKKIEEKIADLKLKLQAIYANDAPTLAGTKDSRFVSHIQKLEVEQMMRIQCWFPDDSLDVSYSFGGGEKFKPIAQGSPGQKNAALLAFILSYGNEPLVLDQPEDDLDNELIYDLIVKQIRENKRRRQVIIVTHNANIVVNGDAENVIALGIKQGQTYIYSQGSLQEPLIRKEICRVLEGGKEAFELRYKRINTGW